MRSSTHCARRPNQPELLHLEGCSELSVPASKRDFLYVLQHLVRGNHVETGILDFAARNLGKIVRTFRDTRSHVPMLLTCVVGEYAHKLIEFLAHNGSCICVVSCF